MNERVYILGPMRGIPYYNFPAFDAAAKVLRDLGESPINPADLDRYVGHDGMKLPADTNWNHPFPGMDMRARIRRDLRYLLYDATAYVALRGWQFSMGARAERQVADWLGLPQFSHPTLSPWAETFGQTDELHADTVPPDMTTCGAATAGPGRKDQKLARFDLLPGDALREVAEHYGRGAAKYAERNWERGYSWSLSFAALQRHAWAFWQGEDADEGGPHMAAVAFHALALLRFARDHRDKDDRPKGRSTCSEPSSSPISMSDRAGGWQTPM